MYNRITSKTKTVALVSLLLLVTMVTWAIKGDKLFFFKQAQIKPRSAPESNPVVKNYDPVILDNFRKVLKNFDGSKPECFISGAINSINYADSADFMDNVQFVFIKKGKQFYHKLGETETINANGKFIYIDHKIKKIIISEEKEVEPNPLMQGAGELISNLRSEYYDLVSKKSGANGKISCINENHITCKEYSITYDTLTMKPKLIYSRLTNFDDPLRTDNERVVTIRIDKISELSNIDRYLIDPITIKKGKEAVLIGKFADYERIQN